MGPGPQVLMRSTPGGPWPSGPDEYHPGWVPALSRSSGPDEVHPEVAALHEGGVQRGVAGSGEGQPVPRLQQPDPLQHATAALLL